MTAAPLEMPTNRPSSLARRLAMVMLSSLLTCSATNGNKTLDQPRAKIQTIEKLHVDAGFN